MRRAALGRVVDLRLESPACSFAGRGGQLLAQLCFHGLSSAAAGSGCTATAVSPSIVSGRVVAIVTCVGSPGLRVDHRIAEVPEVALRSVSLNDFVVADGRLQERVPIHQPLAAIDQAVLEQAEERLPHGARTDVVEREPRALPIAAAAHAA